MSYRIIPGKTRALCTVCGTVRTCAAGWRGHNGTGEGAHSQEHVDLLRRKGLPGGFKERPFDRALGDMKCATCGTVTRHALLLDHSRDEHRNHAELADYGRLRSPFANRVWRLPS